MEDSVVGRCPRVNQWVSASNDEAEEGEESVEEC